jgi:hypothetical protein
LDFVVLYFLFKKNHENLASLLAAALLLTGRQTP